jgi:hypothetical protein
VQEVTTAEEHFNQAWIDKFGETYSRRLAIETAYLDRQVTGTKGKKKRGDNAEEESDI